MICKFCERDCNGFNALSQHLKKYHKIEFKDYAKENGIWPKCKRIVCENFSSKFKGGYCSRACRNKDNPSEFITKLNAERKANAKKHKCKMCETLIPMHRKYCSISCRDLDPERHDVLSESRHNGFENGTIINWTDKRLRDVNYNEVEEMRKKVTDTMLKRNKNISETRKDKYESGEIKDWTQTKDPAEVRKILDAKNLKLSETYTKLYEDPAYLEKRWSKERREKHSKTLTKVYDGNTELRDRIANSVSATMTPESRANRSITMMRLIKETHWATNIINGYKKGWYSSLKGYMNGVQGQVYYRSSYELKAFIILDNDDDVDKWYYENVIVHYDAEHNTIVDLDIYYKDSSRRLVEVKPRRLCNTEENILKINAIQDYADTNGINFEVWCEEEINGE